MEDRTKALIFLYEYHSKGRGDEHSKEKQRAFLALREIAYPAPAEKTADPKKYPSHEPSCPSDASGQLKHPLHDVDPKTYY